VGVGIGILIVGVAMGTKLMLFANEDGTLSGRYPGFPLVDFRAEYYPDRGEIVVTACLAGDGAELAHYCFPFEKGAAELACKQDPSILLVRQQSTKAPWALVRRVVGQTGEEPW